MFEVHKLNKIGIEKAEALQGTFEQALASIEAISGEQGREMAIVRTHLEIASFYAKRAMAVQKVNQE